MMKSEISGRWLDNFRRITYIWLTFWRGVGKFLPDSFTKKWVFFWKEIGYGLPSSRFLIARMLKYVDLGKEGTIVELGGGRGVMTEAILKRKSNNALLTSCEIQKDRYEDLLRYENDHTKILHMDAKACLDSFPPDSVDIVISTLPLGSMNPEDAREILDALKKCLTKKGTFIQYQYFATNKEDIEKRFIIEQTDWEILNFPPAFIYVSKKE